MRYICHEEGHEVLGPCCTMEATAPEWAAEAWADHYHSSHDGWEANWPVRVVVVPESPHGASATSTYSVELEGVPTFTAWPAR